LIAFSGSFEVVLNDGYSKKSFILNKPNIDCTYQLVYERVREFFFRCNMLVLASDVFMEEDYIRDFDEFMDQKK
jgi:hypothetical protein